MKPILVFQSDFTYKEGAVSAMYGVVKSVDRELEIIDGTHEIPRFDTWSASYRLYQTVRFWPEGTVFVSVVDPGVGTARKACAARTRDGYVIVTPDNGSLTHIDRSHGVAEVREIDESVNRLRGKGTEGTSVFHGRDLFGYCAARLASGLITFEGVGPVYPTAQIVRFQIPEPALENGAVSGIFEIGDPNFGNLWTNIPYALMENAGFRYGDTLRLTVTRDPSAHSYDPSAATHDPSATICDPSAAMRADRPNGPPTVFERDILFERSFGYVAPGTPVLYTNELMNAALAVSMGDAVESFGLGYGPEWEVELRLSPVKGSFCGCYEVTCNDYKDTSY